MRKDDGFSASEITKLHFAAPSSRTPIGIPSPGISRVLMDASPPATMNKSTEIQKNNK
jgi:hypothetical protein